MEKTTGNTWRWGALRPLIRAVSCHYDGNVSIQIDHYHHHCEPAAATAATLGARPKMHRPGSIIRTLPERTAGVGDAKKEKKDRRTVEKLQHQGREAARSSTKRKEDSISFSRAFLWCFITRLVRCGQGPLCWAGRGSDLEIEGAELISGTARKKRKTKES